MKKIIIAVVLLFAVGVVAINSLNPFEHGDVLSAKQVKQRWGAEEGYALFKSANDQTQAKMAYAILNDKKLIGKSVVEILKIFGEPDGFYFLDTYPAYIIEDGSQLGKDTWQIVFKLNADSKVRDVIVHKNCCYK